MYVPGIVKQERTYKLARELAKIRQSFTITILIYDTFFYHFKIDDTF